MRRYSWLGAALFHAGFTRRETSADDVWSRVNGSLLSERRLTTFGGE
jgi:hypothetical protein